MLHGMEWDGMGWNVMGWNGMECNGMEWMKQRAFKEKIDFSAVRKGLRSIAPK